MRFANASERSLHPNPGFELYFVWPCSAASFCQTGVATALYPWCDKKVLDDIALSRAVDRQLAFSAPSETEHPINAYSMFCIEQYLKTCIEVCKDFSLRRI